MKVLILGGYGVFGGRLAELLADLPELELFICGRDLRRAEAFCARYAGKPVVRPLALDRADVAAALVTHKPALLVDASGPFQDYGADPYKVVAACIAARVDYLDFADAADFVVGITRFDAAAKAAGVFVLSGVSSFPVLTAAVIRQMAQTMDVVSVQGGIAPSPYAGIGLNVMQAVMGYAGAPVTLLRHGRVTRATGLAESRRYTIAVPGRVPLRNLRFSLVEVPDLRVIPPEHPTMTDIWMGAGPRPEILLRLLNLLAKVRARFGLPSLEPLAGLFHAVQNRLRFGEHRGGMFVHARGNADGKDVERSWHLLAEGDHGPFIPSMAAEAIIRKLLGGGRPPTGARSAVRALELSDYDDLFTNRTIFTGFRDQEPTAPPYRRVLGAAFTQLAPRLREWHAGGPGHTWTGVADVRRGRGPLARLVAAVLGFPRAASRVPLTVTISPEKGAERWTRRFGTRSFSSLHRCGDGRDQHLLVEHFGIASVSLALVAEGDGLCMVPRRWSLLGLPMPGFLLPRGRSHETERDEVLCFDVEISMPLVGLIVSYKGTLVPAGLV